MREMHLNSSSLAPEKQGLGRNCDHQETTQLCPLSALITVFEQLTLAMERAFMCCHTSEVLPLA